MTRARLEFVQDSNKTLVVPVRIGVVFDQVQIGTVRKGVRVHVPVRSVLSQVFASLGKVRLRPVAGEPCDVVWFYYFFNFVYISSIHDGPGTTRETGFKIGFHYNTTR
jgi:hypothetical protein